MTQHASGTFDVTLLTLALDASEADAAMGRRSINKQFHGDLDATSIGEMLSAGTATQGSAGYVAMERVTGALHGRRGSFVLQHSGTMDRGTPALAVHVVPDSGSDELAGLVGTLRIRIADGKHYYDFDCDFAR